MHYIAVYIVSILVGWGLISYGKRINMKIVKYFGASIILIDILVPVLSFIAGYVDGYKAI